MKHLTRRFFSRRQRCCEPKTNRQRKLTLPELLEAKRMLATDVLGHVPVGAVGDEVREIALTLSAPLMGDTARDQANFALTHLGDDGVVGGGDDTAYPILPQYIDGSTMLRLSTLVDLSTWSEVDYAFPPGIFGEWNSDADTGGVTQSLNGSSTFFVSDSFAGPGEFRAQLFVDDNRDDDYVGVVFGFEQNPDTELPESYFLLSWKKQSSGGAAGGLKLAKIEGTGDLGERPDLWSLGSSDAHVTILADGPMAGWESGVPYEISIDQGLTDFNITVTDASTGAEIWGTSGSNDSGLGRVGFYNFSQPNASYWSLETSNSLPLGSYQIRIAGDGVLDVNGEAIDGDGDGQPGGDYFGEFQIVANTAPTVVNVTPPNVTNQGVSQIQIELSEPVVGDDARTASVYQLLDLGADGEVGGGDDRLVVVDPTYVDGSTTVDLTAVGETAIDLSLWTEQDYLGTGAAGDWVIAPDGQSVTQGINAAPTYYVSDFDFFNETFDFEFEVSSTADDDWIGFVFGFEGLGDNESYYAFTWKNATQATGEEGMKLLRVDGIPNDLPTDANILSELGDGENSEHISVLATNIGGNTGWRAFNAYRAQLSYQANGDMRVVISRVDNGSILWDSGVVTDSNPIGPGKVGFFNYSQEAVKYSGLRRSESLPEGSYRIIATSGNPGLRSLAGIALDGDDDGVPGGNFVYDFVIDQTAPAVQSVSLSSNALVVTFDEPVGMDELSATDIANYALASSGGDGIFGDGTDVTIDLAALVSGVSFDAGSQTATLSFASDLPDELYEIRVSGTVQDRARNTLDGGEYSQLLTLAATSTVVSVDLQSSSDSGASDSDNITNITTPTFDLSANKAGLLELFIDGDDVPEFSTILDQPGVASFSTPSLVDDLYDVRARLTPVAGATAETTLGVTVDTQGPYLLGGPATEQAPAYSRTVRFNEAIDELATAAGVVVTLTDPNGQPVAFNALPTGSGASYTFTFGPAIEPGEYTLSANTAITDLAGNLIDQDQDGIGGEVGEDEPIDTFEVVADVTSPTVVDFGPLGFTNADVAVLEVEFSEAISASSFSISDVAVSGPAGAIDLSGQVVTPLTDRSFTISLPALSDEGDYSVTIGPNIADLSQNSLLSAYQASFTIDKTGPSIVSAQPSGGVNGVVSQIEVVFDETINASSLTVSDVALTGPAGAIAVQGVQRLGDRIYRISFAPQQANGEYQLTVGPDVLDRAGNAMDQDGNGTPGEASDAFTHNLTIALPDLTVAAPISLGAAPFVIGQPFDVSWTVINEGDFPTTGPIADEVYLSVDDQWSPDDRLLTSIDPSTTNTLGVGATYTTLTSVTVPLDGTLAPGPYHLVVRTEASNRHVEADETNNWRAIAIELINPPLPDLVAGEIAVVGELTPGKDFTLAWEITNPGESAATGSWTERIYVGSDVGGAGRQLLGSFTYSGPIDANADPVERSETLTLPVTSLNGPVYFFVEVDATNNVVELNEANVFASSTTFNIPAELVLSLSATAVAEGGSSVQATLTRNGDVSQPLVVTLTPSIAGQLDLPTTVTIPAGQYTKRFNVGATNDDAFDGNQQVVITATATDYPSAAAILTAIDNDQPTLTLTLPANELVEGGTLTATVTREVPAATDIVINIISANREQLNAPLAVVLPQGETEVTFQVAAVDDTLIEREAAYSLNVSATGHLGDAAVVSIPQNDVPTLTLNLPGMLAEGSSGPTVLGTISRDVVTDRALVVELASSDAALVSVPATVTIPAGQASVTFPVVIADDGDVNGDRLVDVMARVSPSAGGTAFDEGSAADTVQVLDNDGEALTITIARDTVAEGKTVTATIRRNTADVSAPLTVTLGSDDLTELSTLSPVVIPIGAQTVDVVLSGLEDDEIDGDQVVTVMAQASGFNTGTASVVVVDINLPDLVVTSLSPEKLTALTGETIDARWVIANLGFAPAEGTWTQRIYISSDATIGNDTLAGQYTFTGPLGEGQDYNRSAPVRMPTTPGDYWLVLETDVANTVGEGLETNNARIIATPITISPAYTATVMTDVEMAPADTPVLLTGTATSAADGSPAAFREVSVHVSVRGTKRVLPAVTDAAGNFRVTFTPLPGEGGSYTVGAAHPGLANAPVQDSFKLVGMRAEPPSDSIRVKEGDPAIGDSVTIRNLADVELTGLAVEILDVPANLQVTAELAEGAMTLAEMGTVALNYTVAATDASIQSGQFRLRVTSDEAPDVIIPVSFSVVPLVSRLVATPGSLSKSMLVGDQTSVQFTVENTGGLATGPLSVLLPAGADWLTLATRANLPSLAPGQTASVTLLLTPPVDLPLTAYNGSLVVRGDTNQVELPFSFRAVSEETGDLEITVTDEFFYFTEEKPLVTDATVRLLDAITGQEIASSDNAVPPELPVGVAAVTAPPTVTIDEAGRVSFEGVPEGPYTLEVKAEDHDTYRNTIRVQAGDLTKSQVFISRNLVEYVWTVEEVQVEDRTRITIDAVFETNVPAPVVTVEGQLDLADLELVGQSEQFNITIKNHGLIAAEKVELNFGTHPFYDITPLVDSIGVLPAKAEVTIPVTVTRIATFDSLAVAELAVLAGLTNTEAAQMGHARVAAAAAAATAIPCNIDASCTWCYVCGELVCKSTPIAVSNVDGDCDLPGSFIPPRVTPVGTPAFGGPSIVVSTPVFIDTTPPLCECEDDSFFVAAFVDASTPEATKINYRVVPNGGTIYDLEFAVNGQVLATQAIASGAFSFTYDQDTLAIGSNSISVTAYNVCGDQLFSEFRAVRSAKRATEKGLASGSVFVENVGTLPVPVTHSVYVDYQEVMYDIDTTATSKLIWVGDVFITISTPKARHHNGFALWAETFRYEDDAGPKGTLDVPLDTGPGLSENDLLARSGEDDRWFVPNNLRGIAEIDSIFMRDDAGLSQWIPAPVAIVGLFDGVVEVPIGGGPRGVPTIGPANAAVALTEATNGVAGAESDSLTEEVLHDTRAAAAVVHADVCARARIQISQDAVQERQAFDAQLEIRNEDQSPLTDMFAQVQVFDSDGRNVTHLFGLSGPNLIGIDTLDGDGTLVGGGTARAKWNLLPSSELAVNGPTQYFVTGILSYNQGGQAVTIPMERLAVTVQPQPALHLDYFLQRDVISDDPETPITESAQPFTLAVQVRNDGSGAANNLRIDSAQPRIVENEKGLLVDFEIIGTKINGGEVQPSLTADFGNVGPGEIAIAEWQLEATLQGLFVEYNATFEHISPFGDSQFSLVKSVDIHELIHVINASEVDADGQADFLVNDVDDPEDLPDTLYLSDGSVVEVGLGSNAQIDAAPVLGDFRVDVTAEMADGWSYLKMDDPSLGDLTLIAVERSDGTTLPVENFWQTDRTFIGGGQRPIYEGKIHLLDFESTGSYSFVFSNGDLTGPDVTSFAGVTPNPTTQAIDVVDVTFTERLNDATFDASDISLTKNGESVTLTGLSIAFVSGSTYRVSGLAPYTVDDAVYELTIDEAGLTDQVGNSGEGTESYRWVKGEAAPTILGITGAPSGLVTTGFNSIDIEFSKPIVLGTLTVDNLSLTRNGAELLDTGVTISQVGVSTYRVSGLAPLTTEDGEYQFTADASGVEDAVGNTGLGDSTAAWTLDSTAPELLNVIDPATNPRNIVVQQIDIEFSEPIDISTLDVGDLMLVRDGGTENLLAGDDRVSFEDRGNNIYRIRGINWVQAFAGNPQVADFTLTVDAVGISDPAGNAGVGVLSSTWTIDLDAPAAPTNLVLATSRGPVTDGMLSSRSGSISGDLAESGLTVTVLDITTGTELAQVAAAGPSFAIPIEFPSVGQHDLRIRLTDDAGNTTDTLIEDLFVTETPPVVESITGVPVEFSQGAVNAIDVTFVYPVDPATVTKAALQITRNGGANLVNGTVSVEAMPDGRTFRFNGLAPITTDEGLYDLALDFGSVENTMGLRSTATSAFSWLNDTTGPTSSIDRLQFIQSLGTFAIDFNGFDADLAAGVEGSGVAAYDLYVSDYRSPFQFLETVSAEVGTTTFIGEPNQLYVFRVVARDAAGNVETKPNRIDAWTYVPDVFAPLTQVDSVDTTDATFEIEFSGTDRGDSLTSFDLFVQVDGGDIEKVATIAAGSRNIDGEYSGSYEYQAISDGAEHEYRFFTVGVDRRGNRELEPDAPADVTVAAEFAAPVTTEVVDFDVQNGAAQRSFLQYLDVFFNTSDQLSAIIASLNDGNASNDRIQLTRYELDGSGPGDSVALVGRVAAVDQALEFDFGEEGIGGNRNSSVGDGYYSLKLDLDGDGNLETELNFFRLLGDSDGDGDADNDDLAAINAAMGQIGANLDGDLNGDGRVNIFDRQLWFRGRGKRLAAGLHLDD